LIICRAVIGWYCTAGIKDGEKVVVKEEREKTGECCKDILKGHPLTKQDFSAATAATPHKGAATYLLDQGLGTV
jgi:hypothetical protein